VTRCEFICCQWVDLLSWNENRTQNKMPIDK
jgi:hypothetical protein